MVKRNPRLTPDMIKARLAKNRAANESFVEDVKKTGLLHRLANWLNEWHITRILEAATAIFLIPTVGFMIFDFAMKLEEKDARENARTIAAWQLITTKASGNSGKRWALEYLNNEGEPLRGIDLSPKDWSDPIGPNGLGLTNSGNIGEYLARVKLENADLSNSKLNRANLSQAKLSRTDLTEADLMMSDLTAADMSAADLTEANLIAATLTNSNLTNATLNEANLFSATLTGANLTNVDMRDATLAQAYFDWADLTDADLTWSDLTEADLTNSTLNNADLIEAELTEADLSDADLVDADLTEANLTHATLIWSDLSKANLAKANLESADLTKANLNQSVLYDVINLTCEQLVQAKNWQLSYRAPKHACGAPIKF